MSGVGSGRCISAPPTPRLQVLTLGLGLWLWGQRHLSGEGPQLLKFFLPRAASLVTRSVAPCTLGECVVHAIVCVGCSVIQQSIKELDRLFQHGAHCLPGRGLATV